MTSRYMKYSEGHILERIFGPDLVVHQAQQPDDNSKLSDVSVCCT
jgi:hypothetical protein